MRALGIVRPIDDFGRITIPSELRKILDIEVGDLIDISKDGETILLNKCKEKCVICGREDSLSEFRHKKLCKQCIEQVVEMAK